jgi:chemotaxis protein methyltransferase CheR
MTSGPREGVFGTASASSSFWGTTVFSPSDDEMAEISSLVHAMFGIHLKPERRSFVAGRLHPLLTEGGFASVRQYLEYLKADATGHALSDLANRITTSHTSFFRELPHFDFLTEYALPETVRRKGADRDLRIWSAACASGEEAYALSMTLHKFFGREYGSWLAGLLATDISTTALSAAKDGVYKARSMQTVPPEMKVFFDTLPHGDVRVVEAIRHDVTYRRFNLINPVYPFKKPFDIVFCRNVMIYFDEQVRENLLLRMHRCLVPGGYLFVGHSEGFGDRRDDFKLLAPAVYRRV